MKIAHFLTCFISFIALISLHAQTDLAKMPKEYSKISGFHIGFVQPLYSLHNQEGKWLSSVDDYTIGFPMGIGLRTPWNIIVDLEFVPLIKPYYNDTKKQDVHMLFHPGLLFPMGNTSWTFGLRAAFELEQSQLGFTPLINKSFSLTEGLRGFIELVLPGRFGPDRRQGYTQIIGIHVGFGF